MNLYSAKRPAIDAVIVPDSAKRTASTGLPAPSRAAPSAVGRDGSSVNPPE
ncbi:MAG TPA: hypothetical protein VM533_19530 [Fimbriiglobus sp.]|nr:hypothetical protein [Fimbriiglobus sp.]